MNRKIDRRRFLKRSSLGILGAGLTGKQMNAGTILDNREDDAVIKEYRRLGRTGFQVSDIGCGMPMINDENFLKSIISRGVNYLDTAHQYQNGNNERMIGRAVKEFERESLFITTKIMVQKEMTAEDIYEMGKAALERLDAGYIDCLQLHSPATVDEVRNPAFLKAMTKLKKEGIVRYCGLSSHGQSWYNESDSMDVIINTAIDEGYFDLFLMVYNYVQRDMAEKLLKRCREYDIATTLMKTDPFGGFYITIRKSIDKYLEEGKEMPQWMKTIHEKYSVKHEKAFPFLERYGIEGDNEIRDAAIRFVLDNQDVNSVMITFQNHNDINNYLKLSGSRFTYTDNQTIRNCAEELNPFYCRHACGMCEEVCPHNVPLNTIMRYNHYFTAQKREKYAMEQYASLHANNVVKCTNCDAPCEKACPYGVHIYDLLNIAHANLSISST